MAGHETGLSSLCCCLGRGNLCHLPYDAGDRFMTVDVEGVRCTLSCATISVPPTR